MMKDWVNFFVVVKHTRLLVEKCSYATNKISQVSHLLHDAKEINCGQMGVSNKNVWGQEELEMTC